jgi:hypothetical protein
MGWSHGVTPDGREVGYGVETTCALAGCDAKIDRGLAHLCGEMHGDPEDHRCGDYFCADHLVYGSTGQQCEACAEKEEEGKEEEGEEDRPDDDRHEAIRQPGSNVCVCGLIISDTSAHLPSDRR